MDREAWCAAVHGVAKSWTWLSDWTELNLIVLWSEMLDTISIFLNLLRFVLWLNIWSILENVRCALEKVYSSAFGWNVLKISVRPITSNVSFKTCVSLLIFHFDDPSIGVSGVLKSPTIIVLLSISPFMSVSICLMYCDDPMLGAWKCKLFSHVWLFATLWTAALQVSPSITNPWSLPKLMSIESVMPSNHFILSHPLFLHLQSFPASGSFPMSQFFPSGSQRIGVSASTSVLPMNIQDWFPLGLTGLISLQSKGLSRVFSNTTVQKHQFFGAQLSL